MLEDQCPFTSNSVMLEDHQVSPHDWLGTMPCNFCFQEHHHQYAFSELVIPSCFSLEDVIVSDISCIYKFKTAKSSLQDFLWLWNGQLKDFLWLWNLSSVLSYHLFYTFLWSYLISLLFIYYHPKFHGKASIVSREL